MWLCSYNLKKQEVISYQRYYSIQLYYLTRFQWIDNCNDVTLYAIFQMHLFWHNNLKLNFNLTFYLIQCFWHIILAFNVDITLKLVKNHHLRASTPLRSHLPFTIKCFMMKWWIKSHSYFSSWSYFSMPFEDIKKSSTWTVAWQCHLIKTMFKSYHIKRFALFRLKICY